MSKMANKYDQLVLGHPVLWIALFILVLMYFSYHARDFKLDASADSLLLEDDKDLIQYNETIDRYQEEDYLFITYDPEDELFSKPSLDRLAEMIEAIVGLRGVDAGVSIFDVPLLTDAELELADLDVDSFRFIQDPGINMEKAKKEILANPISEDLLVSRDGETCAVRVFLRSDTDYWKLYNQRNRLLGQRRENTISPADQERLEQVLGAYGAAYEEYVAERHLIIQQIREIIEPYRDHAEIHLVGMPIIADDMMTYIEKDLVVFGIGVCVFIVITLMRIFRRKRWVLLPLMSCLFAVLLMMGILGLLNWHVTVISSNFVSLMLILTLSMNIHLAVRFRHLNREMPAHGQQDTVSAAVRKMVLPCLYTALTTILAFGSLLSSGIKPVIDFGWMMTIGLSITFLTTFLLFPAILVLLKKVPPLRKKRKRSVFTGSLAVAAEKRGGIIITAAIVLALLSLIGISNLRVENSFINYFSDSTGIYQGMELVDDKLGGTNPLDVLLDFGSSSVLTAGAEMETDDSLDSFGDDEFGWDEEGDADDYWFTPFKIERIKQVHSYLERIPEIGKVLSLASAIRFVERLNDDQPLDGLELGVLIKKLPEDMKAKYIDAFVSIENNEARIMMLVRDSLQDLRRKELLDRIRSGIETELGIPGDEFEVSGVLVLYNNMLQSLFRSQILTLGLVLCGIGIMLLVLFRSFKLAVIGIIPNLLAVGIVLGIMGFLDIPLDMMTITIAAITMGIAIDNSIHYIYRFREEYRQNGNYIRTLKICHQTVGKAILNTSVTVIFGFSILVLSNFIPTIYFGVFTGLAMFIALLAILALLPKLILWLRPFKDIRGF